MTLEDIFYEDDNKNGAGNKAIIYLCLEKDFRTGGVTVEGNKVTGLTNIEFVQVQASRTSVKFKTEPAGDFDGDSHNTTIEAFVPKITADKSKLFTGMQNHPLITISEDRNDNFRMTGNKRDGVKMKFSEVTEGQNGYQLTFTHVEAPQPPLFVTIQVPVVQPETP